MNLQILDCTLRDGGYYNDWDFSESIVKKYLSSMSSAKVDIVEIGFRFLPQKKLLGKFAYSEDDFLNTLSLPSKISYAVMINASDLINYEDGLQNAINNLFSIKKDSPVDIIRIATHSSDIKECRTIAIALKNLGYRVFLNLMQISTLDTKSITNIAKDIESWDCIDAFYFADSFGNMNPDLVSSIISIISSQWSGELGIHTHDNKNQALGNSLKAIEQGITYVDATLLGMGRGAGNAKTEALLVEIVQRDLGKYFPDALFSLVLKEFSLLQKQYKWGPNIYYFLSAVHSIHPTYIQEMLGDGRYDIDQMLSAINFLKTAESSFYSFESMIRAIPRSSRDQSGDWSAQNWARSKDVLIIGAGPSIKLYIDEIIAYIERKNPIVLCLNINEYIPAKLVTAYVACSEWKILAECSRYLDLQKPIILPLKNLPKELKKLLTDVYILDYGLLAKEGEFDISDNGCIINFRRELTIAYALSIAIASGAKRILLSGVDGYKKNNTRQQEMITALNQFKENTNVEICAITPTNYPIEQLKINNTILEK